MAWWQWLLLLSGFLILILVLYGGYLWWTRVRKEVASNDRDWQPDCARTPIVEIKDGVATFTNLRDFTWRTTRDRDERWTQRSVKVDELVAVWYIVDHFFTIRGLAHTMASFEFADGQCVVASFESRREKGERYDPWLGLWRAYELYLAWGTERDLIGLRTHARNNKVHMYRVVTLPGNDKTLFLNLCRRTQELAVQAEWYNSLFTTCLTSLVEQVNHIAPGRVPFTWRYVLPGHSARAAHHLGLIEDWGGYRETVRKAKIDQLETAGLDEKTFNSVLRAHLPKTST